MIVSLTTTCFWPSSRFLSTLPWPKTQPTNNNKHRRWRQSLVTHNKSASWASLDTSTHDHREIAALHHPRFIHHLISSLVRAPWNTLNKLNFAHKPSTTHWATACALALPKNIYIKFYEWKFPSSSSSSCGRRKIIVSAFFSPHREGHTRADLSNGMEKHNETEIFFPLLCKRFFHAGMCLCNV